jgi:enoyl-CoA hydratase
MSYTNIHVKRRPPLAVVTIDRPEVLNALNSETISELDAAFAEVGVDSQIRVVLLNGAGDRAFAAGADIRELEALSSGEGRAFAVQGQAVFRRIETLGKPVIACIQGFALGGGCELALACTVRLAADDARMGQPEVKLGVIPGYGGTQRLPRIVGRGAGLRLLLSGAIIDAHEALRIGLVDDVVPAADLMSRAETFAREIAANAPLALAEVLKLVDEGLEMPLSQALEREAERFGSLCATADKAEGTRAFLEKRPAVWKDKWA